MAKSIEEMIALINDAGWIVSFHQSSPPLVLWRATAQRVTGNGSTSNCFTEFNEAKTLSLAVAGLMAGCKERTIQPLSPSKLSKREGSWAKGVSTPTLARWHIALAASINARGQQFAQPVFAGLADAAEDDEMNLDVPVEDDEDDL